MRAALIAVLATASGLAACAPTIKVEVAPINIYAKLDANVRLQLDEDVKAFCKEHLAPYKYPRFVEFVPELPKTATGKIQRFRLREREEGRG